LASSGKIMFNSPPNSADNDADACQFPAPGDAPSGQIPRTNHGQAICGPTAVPGDQAVYLH
jgi:hypothetical protein